MSTSKEPGFIEKWQHIIDFWENPCDAPWLLYVELALPPLGEVVLELLSFGLDDVARGLFRPKNLRSWRHGRRGTRSGRRFKGIPEIGEMIGEHLPGAQRLKNRYVSEGVKFLWIVDGVIQRGLWWWMVADLATDFLYNWTSGILKSEYCKKDRQHRILMTKERDTFSPLPGPTGLGIMQTVYSKPGSYGANGSVNLADAVGTVIFAAGVENSGTKTAKGTAYLALNGDLDSGKVASADFSVEPGGSGGFTVSLAAGPHETITAMVDAHEGFPTLVDISVAGIGRPVES